MRVCCVADNRAGGTIEVQVLPARAFEIGDQATNTRTRRQFHGNDGCIAASPGRQANQSVLYADREGIVIKTSPDALDEVQHAAEREMVIGNLIRDSNVLRNVRRA